MCRPFSDSGELHRRADLVSERLHPQDWLEAFASHPTIGETREVSQWSQKEQQGMSTASNEIRLRLAQLNREYKKRFGFIFIICATGKSAEEMLAALEARLQNSPEQELQVAGQEQRRIVHSRLDKLIDR